MYYRNDLIKGDVNKNLLANFNFSYLPHFIHGGASRYNSRSAYLSTVGLFCFSAIIVMLSLSIRLPVSWQASLYLPGVAINP